MKRLKKRLVFFLLIVFLIITISLIIIHSIDKKIAPYIMDYSISEMKRVASTIINRSITEDITNEIDDSLFIVTKNEEEELVSITLDSRVVNRITGKISDACEDNLRKVEERRYDEIKKEFNIGEEYFKVPSGLFLSSSLLNFIGPSIPISIKMVGNVTSGIISSVKEYGINNSLITVSVEIKVELMVVLPLNSDFVNITNYVPLTIKLIQGKVPHFYGTGLIN